MNQERREKILKLLRLTSSPNDHEALSAIRRVNEMIKNEGVSWEEFFEAKRESLSDVIRNAQTERARASADTAYDEMQRRMSEEINRQFTQIFDDLF